ncbi:hypothetical protein Asp14428_10940 [Actinoplanes sp. NBRC 14428]|uniref:Enoyl-ACP reductase-like protein n=1 Tax=Pseudosporangium ferrugineum TaxID=439699 RepID=A0A2T0SFE4_9ACTN|nr:SDR family oxidoreductase [Pseudosporangium ferrugineum]PRY32138.1 enoyl-ACP reductase-like protein [Pseudosporangium ferrugineum]BCJ49619.1 hypothetical protein Asp14428_10940 [Actinoplanes sp. NBRC 14428]
MSAHRTVVVTGAAGGIGSEIVDRFLAAGDTVVASDQRSFHRDQTPADLVGAILFLASDGAGFLTGQTLNVDGGLHFL